MYTMQQIREMPAGSNLNGLVFKLTEYRERTLDQDALRILECFCKIHKAHWNLNSADEDSNYSCNLYRDDDTEHCCYEFGSTAALAIFRAIVITAMRWGVMK